MWSSGPRANPSSGPTIRVGGGGRGLPVRTHSDVGPFYEGEMLNLSCSVTGGEYWSALLCLPCLALARLALPCFEVRGGAGRGEGKRKLNSSHSGTASPVGGFGPRSRLQQKKELAAESFRPWEVVHTGGQPGGAWWVVCLTSASVYRCDGKPRPASIITEEEKTPEYNKSLH
ncbi:hypothetical protein O3P69_017114 [Scylla paramamosain]|uniref:Uncharacterized protein n=1 Tax=Scylla paramamosain TaxID=85552 RepID=A0AAW0TTV8_SCYPA